MPYILALIALIIGTLIGLQLPDTDQVFSLILAHRSISSPVAASAGSPLALPGSALPSLSTWPSISSH
jgi:hypothetical protein